MMRLYSDFMTSLSHHKKLVVLLLLIEAVFVVGGWWYWHNQPSPLSANQIIALQIEAGAGRNDESLSTLEHAAKHGQASAALAVGQALLARHQTTKAIAWLSTAAKYGLHEAEFTLGKLYFYGDDQVRQDYIKAINWLKPAAKAGYAPATYYMGLCFKNGYGVATDKVQAVKWFQVGAQQQQAASIFMLANAYRFGEGVPKDEANALSLYKRAADMEHPEAIQTLAMAYQYGEMGLKPNTEEYQRQSFEIGHSLKHPALTP